MEQDIEQDEVVELPTDHAVVDLSRPPWILHPETVEWLKRCPAPQIQQHFSEGGIHYREEAEESPEEMVEDDG
jgi:hypothetical protein